MRHHRSRLGHAVVLVAGVLAAAVLSVGAPASTFAHEGHAALPSTGATVDGDQVLVSDAASRGLGLKTATVTLQDLSRVLRVRANVELPWYGQAMVTTLVPGRVQRIYVEPGESVRAGQELARIASLELQTLQLTMLRAGEEVDLAERLLEQRRPLTESGAVAGKSLLETETQLRQTRVRLAVAQRQLMALGLSRETLQQVRKTGQPVTTVSVTSPISGDVVHVDIRGGQFVDTEHHLFNIVDHHTVLVVGGVLETDAWQIEPGQTVTAAFTALPGTVLAGTIDRIRAGIRPDQRTLEVVMPIHNPDGLLRPGMSGRMDIATYQTKEAIVCPTAALINTPGRTFVLLRQGEGKYQRREIQVGLRTPEQVEIVDGLFPGDRVVVTGTKLLASMFHTDSSHRPAPALSSRLRTAVAADPSSAQAERSSVIPVAHAVVKLPTRQKLLATPVIEGRITRIHIQPGQAVEAGQILAELDSQELRGLQLELLEALEQRRRVAQTIQRVESLSRVGGYPVSQLWEHQKEQTAWEHTLQNVERKLLMVGLASEQITQLGSGDLAPTDSDLAFVTAPVRAPAGGRVAEFDVVPGQVVHPDDVLFTVQDQSTVWIEGYVFEQHAAGVEVGQRAEIRFPAFPTLQLTGRVVRTAPTLQSAARVLPVWIEVENTEQRLREGMLASVEILSQPPSGEIAVLPRPQE